MRNDLDRHRRSHLQLEPRQFQCRWPFCYKISPRKDFLLKHMKKRRGGSSDSPEAQEMIRPLYMQSVKAVDEDPLVKRKESLQLAIIDAAVSEDG